METGVALARQWAAGHELVWLTGRPEHLRAVTEGWLTDHGLPVPRLLMRAEHDRRPAKVFKAEQLARLARDHQIAVVVDDDPDVVAALTTRGWPVYLADWVPYGQSLREAQESDGRT